MSVAEIAVFSTAAIISIACTGLMGYYTYLIPSKLRITCLFCVPLHLSILLLGFTRAFFDIPELKWYNNSYLLLTSIYSSALVICIMDIGKSKFYLKNNYNTPLYKSAIIFLFAGNLTCVSSLVLVMLEGDPLLIKLGFSITVISFMISGCIAFAYSFAPIISTIKYKPTNRNLININNSKKSNYRKKQLNPRHAAIGIYYIIALGTMAILSMTCHIILQIYGPASFQWHFVTFADVVIRFGVIMVVGMPPSKKLLKFIQNKLFGMNALNTSIRERGVISSGIVELERSHCGSYNGGIGGGSYNFGGGGIGGSNSAWHNVNDLEKPIELKTTDHFLFK
ncbi:hypothetical protein Glove_22g169 [Diversispora epigaea]|uniref:G-protein coupled receptors family 3 profile domain-containing protein n=1 Tax=Diversispora epigaea TaxID=1348612 RepID=A0A397JJB6_9GLOM|nr:hypothetical protein Glove_22g169 [Diversispora epigaea]